MNRIAIYGGSFNPIHNGHLIIAEEIRQLFSLEKIIFVPAAQPPHKPSGSLIDSSHRLAMLQLAIEDNPYFELSDIEIQRGGSSYTIDTLAAFQAQQEEGSQLYFILGSDAFIELDTWKQPNELFDLARFIVIERPGVSLKKAIEFLQKFNPLPYQVLNASLSIQEDSRIFFSQAILANISSSGVRASVRGGKSIRYLVPNVVKDYIEEHVLYST